VRLRWIFSLAVIAAALAWVPSASADSSQSSNWAGYAVHRSGVSFTKVIGTWTQPQVTCTTGVPTYSSLWVGIGGYNQSSQALEQIGTEDDCTAGGQVSSSAWYELVPAPSRAIKLTIAPGDRVRASVSVVGHSVKLTIRDLTRRRSFSKTTHTSNLDTSSAEWIVEAPSLCAGAGGATCQTLPLANFGSIAFSSAAAKSTAGHVGTITDGHWTRTKISLAPGGPRFVDTGGLPGQSAALSAAPSALTAGGSAFTVSYLGAAPGVPPTGLPTSAPRQVAVGRLVHPGPLSPTS
jgi:hypothetical protein